MTNTTPQHTSGLTYSAITYELTSLPALRLVQHTAEPTSMAEIGPAVGSLFERLLSAAPALGLRPEDPSIAWYEGHDRGIRIGVGMPAPEVSVPDAEQAGLEVAVLPAVDRAAQHRFAGSLQGLHTAWEGLHEALRNAGLTPTGPCREVYLEGSLDQPDSWVIDLQQPIG
jgi:effector-binding domain-containing protein